MLSLLDQDINESQFIRLFSELPPRCVVLLEDIDVAGVSSNNRNAPPPCDATSKLDLNKLQSGLATSVQNPKTPVSISGLLNAVDGVSVHECRVLIMTTNAPQLLDRALIRPGRVDMHIKFELPSREELRGLFFEHVQ